MNQKNRKNRSYNSHSSVLVFAVCMLISFHFGSTFVCMLLPIGYIMRYTKENGYQVKGLARESSMDGILDVSCYETL